MGYFDNLYEDEKKKKPSQVATQKEKAKQGSQFSGLFADTPTPTPTPTVTKKPTITPTSKPKPTQESTKKPDNPIASAIESIKKVAQTAIESVSTALQGKKGGGLTIDQSVGSTSEINNLQFGEGPALDLNKAKKSGGIEQGPALPVNPVKNIIDSVRRDLNDALTDLATQGIVGQSYAPAKEKQKGNIKELTEKYEKDKSITKVINEDLGLGIAGIVSGASGGIVKPKEAKTDTIQDKIIYGVAEVTSAVYTIGKISKVFSGIAGGSTTIGSFIDKYPKVAKYVIPYAQKILAFDVYGQLDPDTQNRFQKLATDTVTGALSSTVGRTKGAISIPANFAIGFGLAKLAGASNEDAFISGGILSVLDASGRTKAALLRSSFKKGDLTMTPEQLRNQAEATNLRDTPAAEILNKAAAEAQAKGMDVKINLEAARKSKTAKLFGAKTPEGFSFNVELVPKRTIELIKEEGPAQKQEQRQPTEPPADLPPVIKEEINKSKSKIRVPQEFKNPIEKKAFEAVTQDEAGFVKKYRKAHGNEVSPDLVLGMLDGYKGHNVDSFSRIAGAAKEIIYNDALQTEKDKRNNTVLVTAGGPGSGKTTSVSTGTITKSDYAIVLDTTFSNNSAPKDIQKALDNGFNVNVAFTLRNPNEAWNNGAIPRIRKEGRIVSEGYFLDAHIGAQKNIIKVYEKYKDNPQVSFDFFENTKDGFKRISFDTVANFTYNSDQLSSTIKTTTEKAYEKGSITKEEYQAILKDRPVVGRQANGTSEQEPQKTKVDKVEFQKETPPKKKILPSSKRTTSNVAQERITDIGKQIEIAKQILQDNTFKDFEIKGLLGKDPKYSPQGLSRGVWQQASKELGLTEKSFVEGTSGNYLIKKELLTKATENPQIAVSKTVRSMAPELPGKTNLQKESSRPIIPHSSLPQQTGKAKPAKDLTPKKKISFSTKGARQAQEVFLEKIKRIGHKAASFEELESSVVAFIDDAIAKAGSDKEILKGLRTAVNKEMFSYVGYSGNYKADYAELQTLIKASQGKDDVGTYLETLEAKIDTIDEKLTAGGSPGSKASVGNYAELGNRTSELGGPNIVEFPELVRLAKSLTGKTPLVQKTGKALGRAYSKDLRIKLAPEIFKDPIQAAKTLSHELGHIADFLPDKAKRGNIVGRIATLRKHMKDKYGELSNKEIREELLSLSAKWRPAFEGAQGVASELKGSKYRSGSDELYADAISVLFNDPALLKQEAPKFWAGFFEYLNRKPTVKENLFATWDLLNKGEEAVFAQRQKDVVEMFDKAEQQFTVKELEKQKVKTNFIYTLKLLFNNKNEPLIRKVNKARKNGSIIDNAKNPTYAYEGLSYMDGRIENFIEENFQPVYEKANEIPDGWKRLGEVLLYERSINERGELANPLGFNPKTAQAQLDGLEKSMPANEWNTLQEALKLFRTSTQRIVKMAEDNEFYSPELLKQMKTNPAYATFQVIDYLDTYVSAHVYKSIGTLKEIANPATSSVMKGISIMKAIERNNAKNIYTTFHKKEFADTIEPAKSTFDGKRRRFVEPDDFSKGMVRVIEKGKPEAYYVEKDLAVSLNGLSNDTISKAAKVARIITGSPVYRPLFTAWNIGFGTFNFIRDFQRYWTNVPDYTLAQAITSFPRAIYRYGQAAPSALRRARKKPDQIVTEMKNLNILGASYNEMYHQDEIDIADQQIDRIMRRMGILEQTKKRKILKPLYALIDAIEGYNTFVEGLPKIAGYNELKNRMDHYEMADFIRTKVGSPNFRVKGQLTPVTNSVFLFSNAIKEGWKSDFQIASGRTGYGKKTNRTSAASFWWKTILSTFLPIFVLIGGEQGLFGKWYKDRLDDISQYDKSNYTVIPTGQDKDGKTTYVRAPRNETQRFLGGLLYKIMSTATRKNLQLEEVLDIFDYGAGQLPGLTPAITGAGALLTYLSGHNPYDAFRNRNVIPDTEFKAGFEHSLPIFIDWFSKNQGTGIILPSYVPDDPTELQKFLALPALSNIVGRWFKVSDYGQVEKQRRTIQAEEKKAAQKTIFKRKVLDSAIKEYKSGNASFTRKSNIEKQLVKDVVGEVKTPADKTARTNLIRQFELGLIYGTQGVLTDSLIKANTNAQKAELIFQAKEELSNNYNSFIQDLLKKKVISEDVVKKIKEKR